MKHFKLNIESKFVPVADLCIAQAPTEDYAIILKVFARILNDNQIDFDIIELEKQTFVAKKKITPWSITE